MRSERLVDWVMNLHPVVAIAAIAIFLATCAFIGGPLERAFDCMDGWEDTFAIVSVETESGDILYLAVKDGQQRCK